MATQWDACIPPSLHPSMPVGSWPSPIPSGSLSFPLQAMGQRLHIQFAITRWAVCSQGSSVRVCPPPLAGPGMKAPLRLLRPDTPALHGPCRVRVPRCLTQLATGSLGLPLHPPPPPCWLLTGTQGGAAQEPAQGPVSWAGTFLQGGRLSSHLPPCWSLLPREPAPSPNLTCPRSLLQTSR